MNVIILGCDGTAARNYKKCVDKSVHNVVGGTGFNEYHLSTTPIPTKINTSGMSDFQKLKAINDLVLKTGANFIHAQPDEEVAFLAKYKSEFESLVANVNQFYWRIFWDKYHSSFSWEPKFPWHKYVTLAQYLNHPSSVSVDDILDVSEQMWVRGRSGSGSKFAMPCKTVQELEYWCSYVNEHHGVEANQLLISPYLPGPEYAVQLFYFNGYLVHAGCRERVQHVFAKQMASGQSSTPSVARVVNNHRVIQAAVDAVEAIQSEPEGIYGVDLRCDYNGDPVPTEVNYGRYFTTSNCFAAAGMNTPAKQLELIERGYVLGTDTNIGELTEGYWIRQIDSEPVWVEGLEL